MGENVPMTGFVFLPILPQKTLLETRMLHLCNYTLSRSLFLTERYDTHRRCWTIHPRKNIRSTGCVGGSFRFDGQRDISSYIHGSYIIRLIKKIWHSIVLPCFTLLLINWPVFKEGQQSAENTLVEKNIFWGTLQKTHGGNPAGVDRNVIIPKVDDLHWLKTWPETVTIFFMSIRSNIFHED